MSIYCHPHVYEVFILSIEYVNKVRTKHGKYCFGPAVKLVKCHLWPPCLMCATTTIR